MTLEETIRGIRGADPRAREAVLRHWDNLAKPLGSLGALEEAVTKIGALTGDPAVRLDQRVLFVLCADNGVIAQGVTQSDESVTRAVTTSLGQGTSTVNFMAAQTGCQVVPVDLGVRDFPGAPGVLSRRVRNGTADISRGPAMTRAECIQAVETGISLARAARAEGASILLMGEMGIGNTTTSCAVASVLLGREPEELVGRGAGLSDAGLVRKTQAIRRAIASNAPDPADPIDVLQKVGGLDLAGLCGLCLGGAYSRIPVLLDGLIADVAALCAARLCPNALGYLVGTHASSEPASQELLRELGIKAPLDAGMHLGEGAGAMAYLPLLDSALRVYRDGKTFTATGMAAYEHFEAGK